MAADLAGIVESERQYTRLGAVSRGGIRFVGHFLKQARTDWPAVKAEGGARLETLRRKIAFGMGGIAHFPVDYIMKPLMSRLAGANWNETHEKMQKGTAGRDEMEAIQEISVYYDLKVFREVYLSGHEEPFNRFLFSEAPADPTKALEEFVTTLFQRALLASHTLAPDGKNLDAWLENLINQVQPLYLSVERYVRIFQSPDPAKTAAYRVDSEFYLASDPAIVLARSIQAGAKPSSVDAAVAEGANSSGYGKAVALGVRAFREASDFWEHRTDTVPDVSQG
ncbi:MAG: hypothetical protein HC888_15915 [Candidatus Competibacteraceae bacterium]|nr:hypothetical protein [Candidatus Competibacteraceae bacterium]